MDQSIQPMLFMLMSTLKNNDNDKSNENSLFIRLLPFIIIIFPLLTRIIPFNEITEYISEFLKKKSDNISITISSHEVPIVRGYSNVPMTKLIYSKTFLSIIHYLSNNKTCVIESLTEILADNTELNVHRFDDDDIKRENKFILIPINSKKILINYDRVCINCEFDNIENKKEESESNDKKKDLLISKKKNFLIILSIEKKKKNNIEILKKFINECISEYDLYVSDKDKKKDDKLYIYEYKNCEKSESTLSIYFDEFPMEHNKDLKINIFFENKDKLINYIKPFVYDKNETINIGEEAYKRSGFTFKAGLLFYGYPGCGKTSTIKAILSYTNRHGIIVNLNKVKTCEELQNIFRKRIFNGKQLNGKQLCFILEDCDAFDNNIIQSRDKKHNENDQKNQFESNELSQIAKIMEMSNTSNVKLLNQSDNDSLNLSCFLNILDGIIELHGIMIIMTTNHPEKIDNALIRPGRFDFKYEFKRASKKIIKEMLQFKYELSEKEVDKYTEHMIIQDEILSPAEVQSICFKNDNIVDCIQEIILAYQEKK